MKTIIFVIFVSLLVAFSHQACPDQDASLVNWSTQFGSAQDVLIQSSQKIKLDTNVQLNTITINGTLVFDDTKNINVTAKWIKVNPGGILKIGSGDCPYTHKAIITFTGSYTTNNDMGSDPDGGGLGAKGLAVTSGGTLLVFGSYPAITWTRLSSIAQNGSTTITVEDAVNWPVGSQIAIASTDFSAAGDNGEVPDQSEQNEIVSISGNTITLKYPLSYMHWADKEGWERAEVGLLTRNIVFQGDSSSDQGGFGGHLIFRKVNLVQVYGAEFYRMGQKGILGRYPIHFHLMKSELTRNISAGYNAIHRSYQRCITIHDGQGISMIHNVAYNITGHCYFLEDGPEQINIIDHNLGIRLNVGSLIPSDKDPAVFWITNPNNTFTNNAACGGAFGYWFSLPMHPTGAAEADYASDLWVWPRYTPLGTFSNNIAHSHSRSGLMVDEMMEPDGSTPLAAYTPRQGHYNYSLPYSYQYPDVIAVFTNFIGYKCREHGVWTRGGPIVVQDIILLDNTNAITCVPGPSLVQNALIVGETANVGTDFTYWLPSIGRSRPVYWTNNYPVTGWSTYDNGGPQFARNITFKNFTTNSYRGAGAITTLNNGPFMLWATDKLEDLHFVDANQVYLELFPNDYSDVKNDMTNGANIIDNDGSVTGTYGSWIVSDTPFMLVDGCKKNDAWNAYVCPKFLEGYTQVAITTPTWPTTTSHYKASWHALGDSTRPFMNVTGGGESDYIWQANVIPFRGYTIRWGEATPSSLEISIGGSTNKEWVIIAIPYPLGTDFYITVDYDNKEVQPVYALKDLNNKYNYFYDNVTQHLYVFVQSLEQTTDELWDFSYHSSYASFVDISANCHGSCLVGTPTYGVSNPSPSLPPAPKNDLVYFTANLGGCFVAPAVDSSYEGVAFGAYDALTGLFTYNVYHTAKSKATRAYLGSSGSVKSAGAEYMQLVGSKSPIKGSIYLSQQKLNDLFAGKLFVTIESSKHPNGELRGFFGCDESTSSQCKVDLTVPDASSFCSLPSNAYLIFADTALEEGWDSWSYGVNISLSTTDYACGSSAIRVYQPGEDSDGGNFGFGKWPGTTIDTDTYKYFSFLIKAEGSLLQDYQFYVSVSPRDGEGYDEYLITREDISSFSIDNSGWAQVLIDVKNLGFGSGTQDLLSMYIYTHWWESQPITFLIDEIKFLPSYTRTTTDAVSGSVHMYNDQEECDGKDINGAASLSFAGMVLLGMLFLAL